MAIKKVLFIIAFALQFLPVSAVLANVFEVTGIASPSEGGEAEMRERAIQSAYHEAINRAGVLVSQKQKDRSRERVQNATINTKREYDSVIRIVGENAVRLKEVIEEGRQGQNYFVRALVEVIPKEQEQLNLGLIWQNAGSPDIALSLVETIDGKSISNQQNRMAGFLHSNLVKNGISLQDKKSITAFNIDIHQSADVLKEGYDVGEVRAYTAYCQIGFKISRPHETASAGSRSFRAGPVAGFSKMTARENCYRQNASQLAENMIRNLASSIRDVQNKGKLFQVVIKDVDASSSARIIDDIVNWSLELSSPRNVKFSNQQVRFNVFYDGDAASLGLSLVETFEYSGHAMDLVKSVDNEILLVGRKT